MARPRSSVTPAAGLVLFVVLVVVGLGAFFALTQDRIERADGQGFDGVHYHELAEQMIDGRPLRTDAPFAHRLGTPWVASVVSEAFGTDLTDAFMFVNLVAGAAFLVLMAWYLRVTGTSRGWVVVLGLVALASWAMPFRAVLFYPVLSDPIPLALLVVVLLVLERSTTRRPTWVEVAAISAAVAAGTLCREQMLFVGLAATVHLCTRGPLASAWRRGVVPTVASLAAVVVTRIVAEATGTYSPIEEALTWFGRRPFEELVLSCFLSMGVVALAAVVFAPAVGRWMVEQPYRLAVVVLTVGVAWVAGSDAERFLVSAAPVVFAGVGKVLTHHDWRRIGPKRLAGAAVLVAVVLVLWQGFFAPLRDEVDPFTLDDEELVRSAHAVPLFGVVNAPTFAANVAVFTPPLFARILLLEWAGAVLVVGVLVRPEVGATLRRAARSVADHVVTPSI